MAKRVKKQIEKNQKTEKEPTLEEWLTAKKRKTEPEKEEAVQFTLPPSLQGISPLPPSLLPPDLTNLDNQSFNQWG